MPDRGRRVCGWNHLPSDGQECSAIARTDMGGAYRWDEVGSSLATRFWTGCPVSISNLMGVSSIAVDPSDANRVYLACGTYTNANTPNGAILRSEDRGQTFQRTNVPFKFGGNENGRGNGENAAATRDPFGWASVRNIRRYENISYSPDDGPHLAGRRGNPVQAVVLWIASRLVVSFSRMPADSEIQAFGFGKAAPNRAYPTLYLAGTVPGARRSLPLRR